MIGYTDIWKGKEVEGRLKGIRTLFIYDFLKIEDIEFSLPHIYFCRNAVNKIINDKVDILSLCLDKLITLEVSIEQLKNLPPMLRIHCHLLLAYEEPAFNLLKPDDEVKFIVGDYHLFSITKENMVETKPIEYKNDIK